MVALRHNTPTQPQSALDQVLWEVEPEPDALERAALPRIDTAPPKDPRELEAMVGARCAWC